MNLQDLASKLQLQNRQSRFFGASRKGENYELKADLNSEYRDRRKDAIKRVIANMTVGKDVSGLFPDVLKNMQTEDIEQKKLVYLYLMNYAKTQPELVILAVNTFVKDTDDPNPLIRALAIRTMGCLRAEKILDYLCDPLRKCLQDDNPYVRKTAAICVAKLYDLRPSLALENGFIQALHDLIGDANPMVVANAVTSLCEIREVAAGQSEEAAKAVFAMDHATLAKLLIALGECTEWGRISILSAVANYVAKDAKEAEHICERIVPQFQHANPSVVLAAVKVVMMHLNLISRPEFSAQMLRKMAPPLVTLVSSAPEVQWVALRNINLILQKRPEVLTSELRVFFCKYNDPLYVKNEKLDIMVKLASEDNYEILLGELSEYAAEADVDFVRRAIRAIGQCAIKLEPAANQCVKSIMDLISTRVSYVVQEAVVILKDIFRKYPQRYEATLPKLCASLAELDEPDARASLIWMIGEYADKIDNAADILQIFLDTFSEEAFTVQIQLLTAIVKLFLRKPQSSQNLIQDLFTKATKNCDNPDIRDRAYIYWRLLSSDTKLSESLILHTRPTISTPAATLPPKLLEELVRELASLASVYHRPAAAFIGKGRVDAETLDRQSASYDEGILREKALKTLVAGQQAENLLDVSSEVVDESNGSSGPSSFSQRTKTVNPLDDLLGLFDAPSESVASGGHQSQQGQQSLNLFDDLI